jgi:hypothetical protein
MVALHDLIERQAAVLKYVQKEHVGKSARGTVKVATLRKEKVRKLKDTRDVYGPSASKILMLTDVVQYAGALDVLDDNFVEGDEALSKAIDTYIRADKTVTKKLRKRYGELKKNTITGALGGIQEGSDNSESNA